MSYCEGGGGTDNLSPLQRRYAMSRVKGKDTAPELIVRRLIYGMGYRYRLHRKDLPGNPDIVFQGQRKIILVHGCFWHGHSCHAGRKVPKSNAEYWVPKLQRNKTRDAMNHALLRKLGWEVKTVWECQTKDQQRLAKIIGAFLRK